MKFIDFFAGVGGFRRGMELAGHECVGFCEFDKYAVMSYTSMHLITEEQRKYLATLDLKARQKEILKDEYRNGEWYANDVRTVDARSMPDSDCWCFGFPCQDISVAGAQKGFSGNRSSLFFEVMRLLDERKENGLSRPRYLFIENVKNLLSVSNGFDFAKVLFALDERGYDAEWSVLDSRHFGVPQHRERCFIIGSLRGSGGSEVFPLEGTDGKNHIHQIGMDGTSKRKNHNQYRLYDIGGLCPTLNKMESKSKDRTRILDVDGVSQALRSTDHKQPLKIADPIVERGNIKFEANYPSGNQKSGIMSTEGECRSLIATDYKQPPSIVLPVSAEDAQAKTKPGLFIKVSEELTVYAIWYEKYQQYIAIRKLTPKECFRLQGWSDDYFERAALVNSNSQLYKQAGNGVTVNVIQAIAEKMK